MSFVSHYFNLLRSLRLPALLAAVGVALALGGIYYDFSRLTAAASTSRGYSPPESSATGSPKNKSDSGANLDWTVFSLPDTGAPGDDAGFISKFHFAGTFFVYNPAGGERRKAVVSVEPHSVQQIVSEGERIDGAIIKHIYSDRIVLESNGKIAELHLSFSGAREAESDSPQPGAAAGAVESSDRTRFGRLLTDNSWMLERSLLLDYYNELMGEPQRLLSVFDSFEPIYKKGSKKIEGYHITVKGEDEFFKEIGLKEGDVIRKVNSLRMTNRNRAEFFIRQVIGNRLNAIVIDIERDGKPMRLVYQVR